MIKRTKETEELIDRLKVIDQYIAKIEEADAFAVSNHLCLATLLYTNLRLKKAVEQLKHQAITEAIQEYLGDIDLSGIEHIGTHKPTLLIQSSLVDYFTDWEKDMREIVDAIRHMDVPIDPFILSQIGRMEGYEFVILSIRPSGHLAISLTLSGKQHIAEWLEEHDLTGEKCFSRFQNTVDLELELFEDVFCNSAWDLDPDDDGRFFISMCATDDEGRLDPEPREMGWFWNRYAIASWVEDIYEKGEVLFSSYYFGEDSLDQQRTIAY